MFSVFVSFPSCRPRPPRGRGRSGYFSTPTVAQDFVTFFSPFRWYNFASPPLAAVVALLRFFALPSTRFRHRIPLPGDMAGGFL